MSSAFCFKGMKEKYKLTQVLSVFHLGFVGGGGGGGGNCAQILFVCMACIMFAVHII